MPRYQVTFARNQDIDNIQHETVSAKDERDARDMFTSCDCYVYDCDEIIEVLDGSITGYEQLKEIGFGDFGPM